MELVGWLWERVERRDAPALLAHALNTPTIRDALLRQAAISDGWTQLAQAAEEAADEAEEVHWSRHSPDVVAAICHWIAADATLRRIHDYDRAAPLARAALAAWANPTDVTAHLAASAPISEADAASVEAAVRAEAASAGEAQLLDDLLTRMSSDLDLAVRALGDPTVCRVLLRHAARSGRWEALAEAADRAVAGGTPGQPDGAGLGSVLPICKWMLGSRVTSPDPRWTHPHDLAEALAAGPALSAAETAQVVSLMTHGAEPSP